ncbi:MAG: TonB-dependent receptor domain-containing protein, partial [bacterium]
TQISLSHKTSIQAELRKSETENGDIILSFNPDNFSPTKRDDDNTKSIRLGLHHKFSPNSNLIGSFIYREADLGAHQFDNVKYDWIKNDEGYLHEVRHSFVSERLIFTSGIGYFKLDEKDKKTLVMFFPQPIPPYVADIPDEEIKIRHINLYIYSNINYPQKFSWTVGGSADFLKKDSIKQDDPLNKSSIINIDQFNPKLGLTWNPFSGTTFRAAGFRVLKRTLISNQTLEPTQIAGFNQFFDDFDTTKSWRYGIGFDQKIFKWLYGGMEFSKRDIKAPINFGTSNAYELEANVNERFDRIYLYWTPLYWLALSTEYNFDRFEMNPNDPLPLEVVYVRTHQFPFGINFFHPSGFSARLKLTYFDQKGEFGNKTYGITTGEDDFWVVDASIRLRFPERSGFFSIEGKNIFDQKFKYQNMDLAHPLVYPKRLILARFTIGF